MLLTESSHAADLGRIQVGHDNFAAAENTHAGAVARRAAHKVRQTAKAARRADPSASSAHVAALNAKTALSRQAVRLGHLKTLAAAITARAAAEKKPIQPAEALRRAVLDLAHIEEAEVVRQAWKRQRRSVKYPSNGPSEVVRRLRQIDCGLICFTAALA